MSVRRNLFPLFSVTPSVLRSRGMTCVPLAMVLPFFEVYRFHSFFFTQAILPVYVAIPVRIFVKLCLIFFFSISRNAVCLFLSSFFCVVVKRRRKVPPLFTTFSSFLRKINPSTPVDKLLWSNLHEFCLFPRKRTTSASLIFFFLCWYTFSWPQSVSSGVSIIS